MLTPVKARLQPISASRDVRVGVPLGRRRDLQRLEDPADRRCADPMAELEQLTLNPLVSQPLFSVAIRLMSAAISALTGGLPVRFG